MNKGEKLIQCQALDDLRSDDGRHTRSISCSRSLIGKEIVKLNSCNSSQISLGNMGESSEMTIKFLRARLLSERSVSRIARQRADQLAKRVAELEEQLRIVTIQRRKAERAAAEVLSILDMQGMGESSEVVDSSSDHDEVGSGSKGSSGKAKEDGSSTTSGVNGSEVDDGYSASELQVPPSRGEGRSLSWKSRMNGNPPERRRRSQQVRHRRSSSRFVYDSESSFRTYLGKSCRKIKRSDKGSGSELGDQGVRGSENERNVPDVTCVTQSKVDGCFDDRLKGKVTSLNGASASKGDDDRKLMQSVDGAMPSHPLNEQVAFLNGRAGGVDVDKDGDMERELEKQAELINQFQAEENAQREWEEKFSRTDGNIAETRMLADDAEEMIKLDKAINLPHDQLRRDGENKFGESCLDPQKGNSNAEKNCDDESHDDKETSPIYNESSIDCVGNSSNASTPHVNFNGLSGQMANGALNTHMAHLENIQGQGTSSGNSNLIPNGQHQMPHINGFREKAVNVTFPVISGVRSSTSQAPGSQTSSAGPTVSLDHELEGVLGALHRAKFSLRQEMSKVSEPAHSAWLTTVDSPVAFDKQNNITGIPISTAGLFRLPTDPLPGSDTVGSGRYQPQSELPGMPVSNRNPAVAPHSSYPRVASSGFQSRLPVRKWEFGSSSRSGRASPLLGRTIPRLYADSTMLGSFTGYGNQQPYGNTQNEQFPSNQYSNNMDFRARR